MFSILHAAFAPIYKKVRFLDDRNAGKGFLILWRSGGGTIFDDNVYGVRSLHQIKLLKEKGVQFEIVE